MFLEIFLSLVTISFFGVFALRPTFLTVTELLRQVRTKEETIIKMDTKIKNLQVAQNILNQESFRIPVLNLSVPAFPQPQAFVRQIEGIASLSQVQILGINVEETQLKGPTVLKDQKQKTTSNFPTDSNSMGFSVSTTGSFQNLFSFLKNLENLRNPVGIDVLGITLSKKEQGNVLTLVVTGKIPYLGESK